MPGSRFRQVAAEVRERILVGDVGEGGALESEAALGERYAVSRVTVRRALEELRAEGLVESRRGAGWFATHRRLAIGSFRHAVSAGADAGKVVDRRVLAFGCSRPPATVVAALDVPADEEALHVRSVRSVDGVALDVVTEWVPLASAGSVSRDDAVAPGIWHTLQRRGHRIATVRQTITADIATDTDAESLGVAAGVPLLRVRRLALDPDGAAVALSDLRYLAHRFSLEVEFRGWPGNATVDPPGLHAVAPVPHPTEEP